MKKTFICVLALATFPSLAQTPPDPAVQELSADWQAYATAQKHLLDYLQKVVQANQALKAENAKLKAPPAPVASPTPAKP